MANDTQAGNKQQNIYTFLDYEVNPSSRELHQVKTQLKISKKSFDILLLLIEKQGQVVTKEELVEQVWPSQIVTDAALNKQITRLRNDLVSHKATEQPIIETIRGVGIRLIPAVQKQQPIGLVKKVGAKKTFVIAGLTLLALFFIGNYLQKTFNNPNKSPNNNLAQQALGLNQTMVEIRSAMSINKKAFISQIERRNELGEMLAQRFEIDQDLSWERRFLKYHGQMNSEELFIFAQIKAYTEGPLLESNQKILDLINAKKEIIQAIPLADDLRNHLIIWLNKYHKVFKNNDKMSLLYVGVEDGTPYPSEVDQQVIDWLEKNNIKNINAPTQPTSVNIALVGAQNADDWLNIGGLQYLTDQLRAHKEIQTITPRAEWSEKGDSKHTSIALSQKQGIDYVLTIKSLSKDEGYKADLVLRNHAGIFSKEVITAASLTLLFDRIDSWVTRQLKISSVLAKGEVTGYKPTEFALESYLRGREVATTKNFSQAIQLTQTAVNNDPLFFTAWLLLVSLEAELGNHTKALALIEHLENREDFDNKLLNYLYKEKASILTKLHKLPEAKIALNKAIELSKEQNDMLTLIDILDVKAEIEFNLGPVSEKVVQIYEEQLTLIKQYSPSPYNIAYATINLSQVYQETKRHNLAVKYAHEAYNLFDKEQNTLGILHSATALAAIYNDMSESSRALLLLKKVQHSYEHTESYNAKAYYLQEIIDSQAKLGLRKQALTDIEKLKELGASNNDYENIVIALLLNVDLNISYKNFDLAQADQKQLKDVLAIENINVPAVYQSIVGISELYIVAYEENPKKARQKFDQHLEQFPDVHTMFAKEMRYINAIILARSGFKVETVKELQELIEVFKEENEIYNALEIGYLLLDLQWKINKQDYVETMNYLYELATFKYPIHKYKARYLAYNKDYINAYVMMADLKSKANEFWTTQDQILLEQYQQLAQKN